MTVVTRNIHQKSYIIKTQANAGFLNIVEAKIFDEKKIRNLFENSDICINLIGILYESKRGNTFRNIHTIFPSILAKLSKEYKLKQFIHLSSLGISEATDSLYAKSKLEGETNILDNFPLANILRPSIVYSIDDNFTTNFMTLLNRLPFFPLYYSGKTKFMPIHCSDLTDIILDIITKKEFKYNRMCWTRSNNFKEIIKKLLVSIDRKRILFDMPFLLANLTAIFFNYCPNLY